MDFSDDEGPQKLERHGAAGVRIRDVARLAGVSPATVSRVLNGDDRVRPAYRARVLAAVEQLDYRRNRLASNMRRQKAEMMGVVISDIENPHFTAMVSAVEDEAFRRGHRIVVCNTGQTRDKQRAYLALLAAERVAGVIIAPTYAADPEVRHLLDIGSAVVAFDRPVSDPRADLVASNNRAATLQATRHLLAAGHRRIGLVSGPRHAWTGADRLAGYLSAMSEAEEEPIWADGRFRVDGGHEATGRLLDANPDLSALVFANNLMTVGGLQALRERKVAIPDGIAVAAVDDPFWAEMVEPPLTTFAQPVREMAVAAVELLFDQINKTRNEPRKVLFDFVLNVRGSCGTVPPKEER